MTTYAIGDVQGCYSCLQSLLNQFNYNKQADLLWFAGDLVNRGPDSLTTLRFVKSLGINAKTVLGNHDLHLLAVYYGNKSPGSNDTFDDILNAPDVDELMNWLRHQPLLVKDAKSKTVMCHAGLYPLWSLSTAESEARYVESLLQSNECINLFESMYGNNPKKWDKNLKKSDRVRFSLNCFTRMRYCHQNGKLDFKQKGSVGSQPDNLVPWYEVVGRKNQDLRILFGHWSTLSNVITENIIPLDTGCVWGGALTAYSIEENQFYKYNCSQSSQ